MRFSKGIFVKNQIISKFSFSYRLLDYIVISANFLEYVNENIIEVFPPVSEHIEVLLTSQYKTSDSNRENVCFVNI